MTSAGARSAQAALSGARAAIDRLDAGRKADENAADLIESWDGAQSALRALIGVTTVSDNALIREARSRNLLDIDEAHALVEFGAAAERARDHTYAPNAADLTAARGGFQLLEGALGRAPAEPRRPASPPPAPLLPPVTPLSPVPPPRAGDGSLLARAIVLLAILAIVGAAGYYTMRFRGRSAHLDRGVAAYRTGDRMTAKREFAAAAESDSKSALPHVYLGRIAREEGDPTAAARELTLALNLDPENPLALREMGAHLLALGNPDLARRFYIRAVAKAPDDKNALGYLACTLARLGRVEEAQRFLQRAGPGEWSPCVAASVPPNAPGVPP
jgi:tetratricopeptide (TPR) repeat protein